jgi:cytochrome o ubiquinol oxidase operon protein cyoD
MSTAHAPDHGTGHNAGHGASHGHHDDDAHAGAHGSMRDYLIGFGLSVVLTAIPFWLVMGGVVESPKATGFIIMGFAVVQIVVHMIYFLHMKANTDEGWTLMALIFTIILVVITLVGSLWVMNHLNVNMMPGMSTEHQLQHSQTP